MLSKRSLRDSFRIEIAVAMTAILLLVSLFFVLYTHHQINTNIDKELARQAQDIQEKFHDETDFLKHFPRSYIDKLFETDVSLIETDAKIGSRTIAEGNNYFRIYLTTFELSKKKLQLRRNITNEKEFIFNLYGMMFLLAFVGIGVILFIASRLSSELLTPIQKLSDKVSNVNESILNPIKLDDFSQEFRHLGGSVNQLIQKINSSISFRRELFVGLAHELKTPLAVMRLKNQITNMKYKHEDTIKETLQQNLDSIDTLNHMIHNVLEFGRAEGKQFEQPKRTNIVRFIAEKAEEYELLAHSKNRNFIYHFDMERFTINIQPLLFMQIFQNFIQNALRFTPENGLVTLQVRTDTDYFIIEVIDEGPGIDESQNFFAPFKRSQESEGAGLGLFLAKNAAESMGVKLSLTNRTDGQNGAIARILFPYNRFLHNES